MQQPIHPHVPVPVPVLVSVPDLAENHNLLLLQLQCSQAMQKGASFILRCWDLNMRLLECSTK
jgi:hypothetical protein